MEGDLSAWKKWFSNNNEYNTNFNFGNDGAQNFDDISGVVQLRTARTRDCDCVSVCTRV